MATEWGWNERAGHDTRVGGGRGEQKGEINFFVFLILPSAGQKEPEGEKKVVKEGGFCTLSIFIKYKIPSPIVALPCHSLALLNFVQIV